MQFVNGILSSIVSAAFIYAPIPAPPTFAGATTTITTGSSAISVANTSGNRNLLIPATFNQRLRPNNLPGTGLSPYRIKSASDSVRSWVGGSNMTASNYIVGAFNGANHCYYYHLGVTGNPSDAVNGITGLYGNAIAGSGATFIFSDVIVKDVTFAAVRINDGITGSSYQNIILKYVRAFGYPIEGEGIYVGNTSKTTYSVVTNSTYEHLFLYNKGRDGFQINNNANFYANKITVLNVGIENASAQRSLIQIQNCNGTLENSIFYNAPKLGVVCGHNLTFNNCYFYFNEQGDLQRFATEYTSSPMANHLPIVFNNCHFGCSTSIASAWNIQEDGCNISFINCTKSANITALYTDSRSDKVTYTLSQSGTSDATTRMPTFNSLDWSNEDHGCITSTYHYLRGLGYRAA